MDRGGQRSTEDGGWGAGVSGLVLSLMRILINPAEAALRPPRFIRPEKPDCQHHKGKKGGVRLRKRKGRSFLLMKQRSGEAEGRRGKAKKVQGESRGGADGRMASGDNSVGHWTSHGCHRSPDWLSDGFNTAAKPFNTGCLLLCVRVSVCVSLSVRAHV